MPKDHELKRRFCEAIRDLYYNQTQLGSAVAAVAGILFRHITFRSFSENAVSIRTYLILFFQGRLKGVAECGEKPDAREMRNVRCAR